MSKKATKDGTQKKRTLANVQRRRARHAEQHPNDAIFHSKKVPVHKKGSAQFMEREKNGDPIFTERNVVPSLERAKRWVK